MSFRQRLKDWERPLVLYEVLPPPQSAPREEIADTADYVRRLLSDVHVDAINVPEVRNESREGNRKAAFMLKHDPRQFALTIQDVFGGDIDIIVNHGVVYDPVASQREWLDATYSKFGIHNVVMVGGESSSIDYPGPSVGEGATLARDVADELGIDSALGAITIPSRRGGSIDEPERMVAKQQRGIEFFTSQVIFEADTSRALLTDYAGACREAGLDPVPVFLSFAPITGRKDAEFLEWLGVEIPDTSREWILAPHANALERSVRAAEHILRDILNFVDRNELGVPVGINVEHIMRYNFEASEVLLERLTSLVEWQELERRARRGNGP